MNRPAMIYPPLSKGFAEMFFADGNFVMWRSIIMLVPHGVAQRRRNTYYVKKHRQDLLQEDQIYPTIQSTGQKERSNEVVSKMLAQTLTAGELHVVANDEGFLKSTYGHFVDCVAVSGLFLCFFSS
ncbi:hypothetical protein TNCV_3320421 [Trichonephila clavipes]|nr:hypothetical protein TNCV_3320421 [Trichonephila clavipes]